LEEATTSVSATRLLDLGLIDGPAPSPSLGLYGDPAKREAEQYFLGGSNRREECPFKRLQRADDKKDQAA
jgi:FPC/CPF motif-containing protein YcgG